ncbi:hypothetical protein RUND412_010949 [Rhizina undulata]
MKHERDDDAEKASNSTPQYLVPEITRSWDECEVEITEKPEGVGEVIKVFLGLVKNKNGGKDVPEDNEKDQITYKLSRKSSQRSPLNKSPRLS